MYDWLRYVAFVTIRFMAVVRFISACELGKYDACSLATSRGRYLNGAGNGAGNGGKLGRTLALQPALVTDTRGTEDLVPTSHDPRGRQKARLLQGLSNLLQSWTNFLHTSQLVVTNLGKWKVIEVVEVIDLQHFSRYLYIIIQCLHRCSLIQRFTKTFNTTQCTGWWLQDIWLVNAQSSWSNKAYIWVVSLKISKLSYWKRTCCLLHIFVSEQMLFWGAFICSIRI